AKALSNMAPASPDVPAQAEEALRAWLALFAPDADVRRAIATTGVRPALRLLFSHLAELEYELWLPEDVYPEYGNMALAAGLRCRSVIPRPEPDFAPLAEAGPRAAVLLPQPLSPLGRPFVEKESRLLGDWLAESSSRRLLLDTVYHFGNRLDPVARALW